MTEPRTFHLAVKGGDAYVIAWPAAKWWQRNGHDVIAVQQTEVLMEGEPPPPPVPSNFVLNGIRHDWPSSEIRGLDVRNLTAETQRDYKIFIERDDEGDLELRDGSTVNLPARFYSCPPCAFGG